MKKLSPLLLATLLLAGCNSVNENDWVQSSGNNPAEDKMQSIVRPDSGESNSEGSGSSETKTQVEQVKTEFWPEAPRFKMGKFKVTKIFEGDLIELNGQEKVRLLGVSTKTSKEFKRVYLEVPEDLAIQYLSEQILNKTIYLEQHPKFPRNPDGETVAYVWMGNAAKLSNVNALMLQNGVALSERIENVTLYDETFKKLENEASNNKIGVWKDTK